ncbi:hypothetical protein GOBAR_AA19479 [Gossypium barbadense]|uniref:Myb/SANT-like domain-containing protein n=1 Tax=Gossypium barbadense TaxID=3634 RepID=A0A2P5XCX5_GOSBA|nr:hypothetical protein GOBAR_AA19479 [Gossypium barbadense]
MINFEKETGKAFSQRQLKNRWDALKKEWKAWKKLKGEDTGLGWNPIKRTVDTSDDWWESRLKVVPEAQKFRTSGIDPEFEGKLDQMFMGIVATGDKAWTPSSGTLRSDFFEDVNNEIHEEDDEENVMSIVENYSGDESDDERKKKEILQRMECFNQLFVVASSSVQLYYEKYILKQPCMNSKQSGAIDGTHIATILPPNEQIPYIGRKGIPTQNVMAVCDFNMCFTFVMAGWEGSAHDTRIFLDAIRYPKYKFPHPPNGKYYLVDSGYPQMKGYLGPYRGAIDGTHIATILPPNEQIPYIGRKGIPTQNVMAVCDFNMCFTFVMAGWEGSAHDTRIFLDAIRYPKYKFPHPPNGKYYLVDSGYPQMKGYLGPYRGQRYHFPDFRRGRPMSDFMEYEDINWAYENTIDSKNTHGRESDDDDDDDDDGDDDGESSNSSGFEMELTRDAIASSLMNSL